jgi:acyl-CoA thioester hydrolase
MDRFPLKIELRIDWSDIDLFGHVNNIAILRYVQAARVNYLEAVGLMQSQAETGIGPILASTSCQFRKPMFYPGHVTVYSTVDAIYNSSFKVRHAIYDKNDVVTADAHDIIVLFDFRHQKKLTIPDDLRERIEQLQNTDRDHPSTVQHRQAVIRSD